MALKAQWRARCLRETPITPMNQPGLDAVPFAVVVMVYLCINGASSVRRFPPRPPLPPSFFRRSICSVRLLALRTPRTERDDMPIPCPPPSLNRPDVVIRSLTTVPACPTPQGPRSARAPSGTSCGLLQRLIRCTTIGLTDHHQCPIDCIALPDRGVQCLSTCRSTTTVSRTDRSHKPGRFRKRFCAASCHVAQGRSQKRSMETCHTGTVQCTYRPSTKQGCRVLRFPSRFLVAVAFHLCQKTLSQERMLLQQATTQGRASRWPAPPAYPRRCGFKPLLAPFCSIFQAHGQALLPPALPKVESNRHFERCGRDRREHFVLK